MAVPWNGEHHAAIAGMRDHDGALAGKEGAIEDQVHPLAGRDYRRDGGIRLPAQGDVVQLGVRLDVVAQLQPALRRLKVEAVRWFERFHFWVKPQEPLEWGGSP